VSKELVEGIFVCEICKEETHTDDLMLLNEGRIMICKKCAEEEQSFTLGGGH